MSYHVREACRLCDAKLPDERVLDLGSSPLANALVMPRFVIADAPYMGPTGTPVFDKELTAPLYLVQCSACGHVQLPVCVDPKLLFPPDYPYCSSVGESMRKHLRKMASDLSDTPNGALVVEIGSNDGLLLDYFQEEGWATIGVDPAAKLASAATRAGRLTIPEFFDRYVAHAIRQGADQAQLIVANNVFAHADDLHEIVEGVKVLLAAEGRFVFEVGYLPDVLRTNNFPVVYHEHLSYHALRPLMRLFARHGLSLYDAHRVDTQGGSVRCFVKRGDERCTDRLVALHDAESSLDLSRWQLSVNAAATRLRETLTWRKSQGKSIAAYGCSAKSTTLLHVAGIGRETIGFICDDAPTKQGKYSPGKHIPIVPGTWLEEKQPDYCVSLSGNFSEAFKASHPEFKGEWIEPRLT